jgi:hypothetical protein
MVAYESYYKMTSNIPSDLQRTAWTSDYPPPDERILTGSFPASASSPGNATAPWGGRENYTPISVVSFTDLGLVDPALEWYAPGWWLMKLDDIMEHASFGKSVPNDYWWRTAPISNQNQWGNPYGIFCRYNPVSDPVAGTFHDAEWEEPGAAIRVAAFLYGDHPLGPVPPQPNGNTPNNRQWFFVQFLKGGPADFPVGQRLNTTVLSEYCNQAEFSKEIHGGESYDPYTGETTPYEEVVDPSGNIPLKGSIGESGVPDPYPATVPWPSDPLDLTDGYEGDIEDLDQWEMYFKIRLRKA